MFEVSIGAVQRQIAVGLRSVKRIDVSFLPCRPSYRDAEFLLGRLICLRVHLDDQCKIAFLEQLDRLLIDALCLRSRRRLQDFCGLLSDERIDARQRIVVILIALVRRIHDKVRRVVVVGIDGERALQIDAE